MTPAAAPEAFWARFETVPDFGQRVELLAGAVRECELDELLDRLGCLVRAAQGRRPSGLLGVLAWVVMSVLPGNPLRPRERLLYRAAEKRGDPLLITLLQPPFPLVLAEPPPPRILPGRDGKPLSLGERRAAARRPDRLLLDRLLADPDPGVVARLLRNPACTEREAVRIAAWRPGRPDVLLEVLRCPRWAVQPPVQAALIRNPSTPAAIAARLTLLLPLPKLREVYRDQETPLLVRLACERHLSSFGRRRGVPARLRGPEPQ